MWTRNLARSTVSPVGTASATQATTRIGEDRCTFTVPPIRRRLPLHLLLLPPAIQRTNGSTGHPGTRPGLHSRSSQTTTRRRPNRPGRSRNGLESSMWERTATRSSGRTPLPQAVAVPSEPKSAAGISPSLAPKRWKQSNSIGPSQSRSFTVLSTQQ